MIQNPIHKVLSVLRSSNVKYLLMGGQACILYGGAEFSRDTDIVIHPDESNITALKHALAELKAEIIAVPECSLEVLNRGHAVHYRCNDVMAMGVRLDVMSVLRNVDPFDGLWQRRTTIELEQNLAVNILALPDLVKAKKTQRDKDWPMIRRLIEADYEKFSSGAHKQQIMFWICDARTPFILRELYIHHQHSVENCIPDRPLLKLLPDCSDLELEHALRDEEDQERITDKKYWDPLKKELENLRHGKIQNKSKI